MTASFTSNTRSTRCYSRPGSVGHHQRTGAFDTFIMFKRPMEVALRHFDLLYSTFCLRSWVSKVNEPACRDQYTQLLDHLRICYGLNFDVTSTSHDLIEFLLGLDFLQERDQLLYLFKLCCSCATTSSPTYPDVTIGSITTAGHQSRFTDVILPFQSFMAAVPGSVALCSPDANLGKFYSSLLLLVGQPFPGL